jgi:hypothetical protein
VVPPPVDPDPTAAGTAAGAAAAGAAVAAATDDDELPSEPPDEELASLVDSGEAEPVDEGTTQTDVPAEPGSTPPVEDTEPPR